MKNITEQDKIFPSYKELEEEIKTIKNQIKKELQELKDYEEYSIFYKIDNSSIETVISFYNKETKKTITALKRIKNIDSKENWKLNYDNNPLNQEIPRTIELKDNKITIQKAVQISLEETETSLEKDIKKILAIYSYMSQEQRVGWNITLLKQDFSIINLRIDADSGEILNVEEIQLFQKY